MSTTRKALFTLAALSLIAGAAHPVLAQSTIIQPIIVNGSFESDHFSTYPGYAANTTNHSGDANGGITGWTTVYGDGLNPYGSNGSSDSPFANNGAIPDGKQVAFIQGGGTTLTQTLNNLVFGNQYQISFYDNSRANYAVPTLSLLVGGNQIFSSTIIPVGGTKPYNFVTASFFANGTSENLQFANTTQGGADATALIDNVSINATNPVSAAPEPSQIGMLALAALGLGALAVKARKRTTAAQAA